MTFELNKDHLAFIDAIQADLTARKSHTKISVEKLAAGFGITSKNLVKELTELAIVRIARKIAQETTFSVHDRYLAIVDLYHHQVNLSHRTSESIMLQQYSTPAPIAFLAGTYILGSKEATYFEPSAGNGLLTIALPEKKTIVNEIDPVRNANLRTQDYAAVIGVNAINPFKDYHRSFDGIITNPPFGTLPAGVQYGDFTFKTLDHVMALRALDCMADHGKAAIIIGGHTNWDERNRIQAGKNRIFFNYLYHHYNVDEVLNLDGHKLYSRQGTAFDVRLILISGRKETPAAYAPLKTDEDTVVFSFEDLWERVSVYFTNAPEMKEFSDREEQLISDYANDLAKQVNTPDPAPYKRLAEKIVRAIHENDIITLRQWMNGVNPRLNRLFTKVTGLPAKTQKEANESIRSLNPAQWDQQYKKPDPQPKLSKEEAFKRMKEAQSEKILSQKGRYDGVVRTRKEQVEFVMGNGGRVDLKEIPKYNVSRARYNRMTWEEQRRFEEKSKETKTEYRLFLPGGNSYYTITKAEYDYGKKLSEKSNSKEKAIARLKLLSLKIKLLQL